MERGEAFRCVLNEAENTVEVNDTQLDDAENDDSLSKALEVLIAEWEQQAPDVVAEEVGSLTIEADGPVTSATQLVALMDNVGEMGPSRLSITESEMIEAAEQAEMERREQRQMEEEQERGRRMRDWQG